MGIKKANKPRPHTHFKDADRLKVKQRIKIIHANTKKAEVALVIPDIQTL